MLGAPPLDGEEDDGHVGESQDRDHGGHARALGGLFDGAAQHDVAGINDPADQHGGQPRVPGPPNAPDDASPDHSGEQVGGAEGQAHLGGGGGEGIVLQVLRAQVHDARDQGGEEAQERRPGHGHVEKDDPENGALRGLVRQHQQNDSQVARQQQRREPRTHRDSLVSHCHLTRTDSISARASALKMTSNATSSRTHCARSAVSGSPIASGAVNCMAASRHGIRMG